MSDYVAAKLARSVRERARNTCEYCRLPQATQEAVFHIDHVIPRSAGGDTSLGNLALACVSCSLRKAARTKFRDPRTDKIADIFNPRTENWGEHFALTPRWRIRGRSPTGRATIAALNMNRRTIVAIRGELAAMDRFPPA